MIEAELQRIEKKFKQGIELIEAGKIKQARRISRGLQNSWAVSESSRAEYILEGLCLLHENRREEARRFCLDHLSCLWTDPYALSILRASYESPSENVTWFDVEIAGSFGGANAKDYRCRFLVLAQSDFEALRYIEDIFTAEGFEMDSVIDIQSDKALAEDGLGHRGVYATTAFTYRETPEPFLKQSGKGQTKGSVCV